MRRCVLLIASALLLPAGCDRTSTSPAVLHINEVMPRNDRFEFTDSNGLHLDWVEIYNPSPEPVALGGYSLTDNPNRPEKYRFPVNESIDAFGYKIVFLAGSDLFDQATGAAIDPSTATDAPSDASSSQPITLTSLHADFAVNRSDDVLLLYARGDVVVDRVEIHNVPTDVSVGRFPDGARTYGPMFQPTPAAENLAAGVEPVRWRQLPRDEAVLPGGEVVFELEVLQDAAGGGVDTEFPDVWATYVVLEGACDLFAEESGTVEEPVEVSMAGDPEILSQANDCDGDAESQDPALSGVVDPDDGCRRDVEGKLLSTLTLRATRYRAVLPSLPCGTTVRLRVFVDDGIRELRQALCYEYCSTPPTLVVSEYQPRNRETALFVCETCGDAEAVRSPDWIEIYNYGTETIDLTGYAITGRRDLDDDETSLFTWKFGEDTRLPDGTPDPYTTTIGPGEYRIVLADQDGGDSRRIYRRLVADGEGGLTPDRERAYYSTRLGLNPSRDSGPDEFLLVSPNARTLDRVILDFQDYAASLGVDLESADFLADASVARFPELDAPDASTPAESYPPDILQPGTVTPCPTPGEENRISCDLAPTFSEAVWVFPRSPLAEEAPEIRAELTIDAESGDAFEVELHYAVDGVEQPTIALSIADGIREASAASQVRAVAGGVLWLVDTTLPPQAEGTVVTFSLRARDLVLGLESELSEETAPLGTAGVPRVSFAYRVGSPAEGSWPAEIHEVVPGALRTTLPLLAADVRTDYVELYCPPEFEDGCDLTGCYLAQANQPEHVEESDTRIVFDPRENARDLPRGEPLRHPREWGFPDGTWIGPGERLVLAFSPLPEELPGYVSVEGFGLDDCEETLYIIGPDAAGNPITGAISWNMLCNDDVTPQDVAVGSLCAGAEGLRRLSAPTPAEPNSLPPLLHDVEHLAVPGGGGDGNPCVAPGSFLFFRGTVLVDRALLGSGRAEDAVRRLAVEFESGESYEWDVALRVQSVPTLPDGYPELYEGLIPGACFGAASGGEPAPASSPACHARLDFVEQVIPVPAVPVARYRVAVEDACGNTLRFPCDGQHCFDIITTLQEVPPVVVNEVAPFAPVPEDGPPVDRPWVEIHNPTDQEAEVGGMELADERSPDARAQIPTGVSVPAGGYLVVLTDGGEPLVGEEAPPHLVVDLPWERDDVEGGCRSSGTVLLFDRAERGGCLASSLVFAFGTAAGECSEASSGRVIDGGPIVELLPSPTPGLPNTAGPTEVDFLRGDATRDGKLNVSDPVEVLGHLFGGKVTRCPDALDADDSGTVNIADAVFLLEYLFQAGVAPSPPFPEVGPDPTVDDLSCFPEP